MSHYIYSLSEAGNLAKAFIFLLLRVSNAVKAPVPGLLPLHKMTYTQVSHGSVGGEAGDLFCYVIHTLVIVILHEKLIERVILSTCIRLSISPV